MMNAENMGEKWVAGWNSKDSVAFSMLYSPHGKYIDPSFGTCSAVERQLARITKNGGMPSRIFA